MADNGGCCRCCFSIIFTVGLTALSVWLSLRTSNPNCSIHQFYLPALNNSLNSYKTNATTTTIPSNTTLYFKLTFANPNRDKRIYYDAINLTFYYQPEPPNITTAEIGGKDLPGFRQGHKKKASRIDSVETRGVDWEMAFRDNKTVVFRVSLTTMVRFKILFWKTKKKRILVGANVEVDDEGTGVHNYKKGIKLKSGASSQVVFYRAHLVAAVLMSYCFMYMTY